MAEDKEEEHVESIRRSSPQPLLPLAHLHGERRHILPVKEKPRLPWHRVCRSCTRTILEAQAEETESWYRRSGPAEEGSLFLKHVPLVQHLIFFLLLCSRHNFVCSLRVALLALIRPLILLCFHLEVLLQGDGSDHIAEVYHNSAHERVCLLVVVLSPSVVLVFDGHLQRLVHARHSVREGLVEVGIERVGFDLGLERRDGAAEEGYFGEGLS
mmetsp:Transcript_14737/g.33845  ORF Transcript_14737/g.33845 Transcript_14737/m.33845 type:complete len:213 (-) Transcript_14737:564-1202(-)